MGTDNLFHKRREKSARTLSRRKARQKTNPRILVVCEGKKTEPNYFNGLKDALRLNGANVEITGKSSSSPTNVVTLAENRYKQEKKAGFPFDQVFCVFDKDSHANYQKALAQIKNMKPKGIFHAITSVPSFEYYLLLHYKFTTQPYTNKRVLSDLKKHIPGYDKGDKNIFATVCNRLEDAKTNAQKSMTAAVSSNTDNPSTRAHELTQFMQKMG